MKAGGVLLSMLASSVHHSGQQPEGEQLMFWHEPLHSEQALVACVLLFCMSLIV